MGFIAWIVVGAIAGFLASKIMGTSEGLLMMVVLGIIGVIGDLTGGFLADRFGPKRVLVVPWLLLIVAVVPVFGILNELRTANALLGATAVLTLFHILGSSPALLLFVQALPARVRAGATGTVYALAIAIFGGTTQLFETLLIRWTGNPVAPGWYMMGAVIVALTGALLIPDPRRRSTVYQGQRTP